MSIGHGEKRSRKRTIAIGCLLSSPTIKAAAKAAGISEATLHRWLRTPDFADDYRLAREQTLGLAAEQLRLGTLGAVATLLEIAMNKKLPSSARVSAARTVLESTSLLHGNNVTVNNQIITPSDPEAANTQLVETMRGLVQSDPWFRQQVRTLVRDIEQEEANGRLPN